MRSRKGLPALLWLFACGTLWAQTPVPFTNIQMRGSANGDDGMVLTYRAYQNPGVPYRILCPVPCTADQNAIYGLYAGFGQARQQVVNLMGVDSLSVNQPFDLHVTDDHWCGTASQDFGGDSGQYPSYSQATGTFGCFWFTTPGRYYEPFQYPQTSTIPYQLLTAHEFTHTEFFTRHWLSYEDFAKSVSFYVSGIGGAPPITDPCDPHLNSVQNGKLIWGLCHQSGFQWSDLAPAMQSINTTYLNGKGETSSGSTSPYQFRKALEAVLGKGATDAFLASKLAEPGPIGGDGTFRPAGGRVGAISGWISFLLAPNAVSANTNFHIEMPYIFPSVAVPPGVWDFSNMYRITKPNGSDVTFQAPVEFQFKYEPGQFDSPTDEGTLQLYHFDGTAWQLVPGSRADAHTMTISAPITKTGYYIAAGAAATSPAFRVIPRAETSASVRTHVVLFNSSEFPVAGQLVYHPENVAASPGDPTIPYSLNFNQTLVLPDVLAAFAVTTPGTIDVVPSTGPVPDISVREVDLGGSGFPGAYSEAYPAAAALTAGEHGLLFAPSNAQTEDGRFLVRTFGSGVTLTVTARNTAGAVVATTPLTYAANTLFRVAMQNFTGGQPVTVDETFEIVVGSGSALLLRETIENGMSAHNYEYAQRIDASATGPKDLLHLPKVVLAANPDGSTSRTGFGLLNASGSTIKGIVSFHPSDGSPNVRASYSLAPWKVSTGGDILGNLHQTSGTGSFDIQTNAGPLPVSFARLVHAGGSQPFQVAPEPLFGAMETLRAGDRTSLVVPDDLSTQDFRIGIRTFQENLAVTIMIRPSNGGFVPLQTKSFPAKTASETSVAAFLGMALQGGEILDVFVDGGAGLIYGSGVSTATGAANYQVARRQPYNF